jgi:hypothetical protein
LAGGCRAANRIAQQVPCEQARLDRQGGANSEYSERSLDTVKRFRMM